MFRLLLTLILVPQFLCASTPIADRLAVLETYYGANPDNPDRTVFEYYQTWHTEDVRDLNAAMTTDKNKAHLTNIYRAAVLSFVEGKISFPKLAVFYSLYSLVMTHEVEPLSSVYRDEVVAEHIAYWLNLVTNHADKLERVLQEGQKVHEISYPFSKSEVTSPQTKLALTDDLDHFLRLGRRIGHVRFVPFVSASGVCSTRHVNHAFALGTPIMRVNLTKARDIDSVLLVPAEITSLDLSRAYFDHQIKVNMGAFGYGGEDPCSVKYAHMAKYKSYRLWDARVKAIADPEIQRFCDFALNLLMLDTQIGVSPQPLSIFEQHKGDIRENLMKLYGAHEVAEDYWKHLKNEDCREEAQYYYDHISAVRYFMGGNGTHLLDMDRLVKKHRLPRDKILTLAVLQDKMGHFDMVNEDCGVDFDLRKNLQGVYEMVQLGFGGFLDDDSDGLKLSPYNDYLKHVERPLIQPYNEILSLVQRLSKAGHPVQMWDGEELNLVGVSEVLDKAFNAFYAHILAEDLSLTRAVKRVRR